MSGVGATPGDPGDRSQSGREISAARGRIGEDRKGATKWWGVAALPRPVTMESPEGQTFSSVASPSGVSASRRQCCDPSPFRCRIRVGFCCFCLVGPGSGRGGWHRVQRPDRLRCRRLWRADQSSPAVWCGADVDQSWKVLGVVPGESLIYGCGEDDDSWWSAAAASAGKTIWRRACPLPEPGLAAA